MNICSDFDADFSRVDSLTVARLWVWVGMAES